MTQALVPRGFRRRAKRFASFLAMLACLAASGCLYARVFYFGIPNLRAQGNFDNRAVPASTQPVRLPAGPLSSPPPLTFEERKRYRSFDELLEVNATRAFVAIHEDHVVYERYFGTLSEATLLPSFSVSKTYAASLVGAAIDDGLFGSLTDSIVQYIPELASLPGYADVTLDDLLRMTSGIDFNEESIDGATLYYCTDLRSQIHGYPVTHKAGTHYQYGSVNIQLLWEALHRRLRGRTVSDYFAQRIWQPLGAEHAASWSLDSQESGVEKFFGGFTATARDHARVGLLYLHGGEMFGQRVLPEAWVDRALAPDAVAGVVKTTDGDVQRARYQWFMTRDGRAYFAKGYNGQYIFVVPDRSAVFVRFGEGYGDIDWPALFERFADGLT